MEMRLVATYHSPSETNYFVYGDGEFGSFNMLTNDGEQTIVYDGTFNEAIAQFAVAVLNDVDELDCVCGKEECSAPNCEEFKTE